MMNRASTLVLLSCIALSMTGCCTDMLIRKVGHRTEKAAGQMTGAYFKGDTLAIRYQAKLEPGDETRTYERVAFFDLALAVTNGAHVVGIIHTNSEEVVFDAKRWRGVQRIPYVGWPPPTQNWPEQMLSTNTIVIREAYASYFEVVRSLPGAASVVIVTPCTLPWIESTTWWRRPAQIIGFPFAVAADVVMSPVYVCMIMFIAVYGI